MTLSDWASIAIIALGALLVVSLVLVWYQLRESTRLVRAANTQKLVELSSPFNLRLAQDRALMELCMRGGEHFDELDEVDRARYITVLSWWLTLHENIYHQWRSGLIDPDTFASWTRDLEYWARRQRLRTVWPELGSYYEASFAQHVTELIDRLGPDAG